MFTDIVGYTALAQKSESSALELLQEHRRILRSLFAKHNGLEIKTIGDAFFVQFPSTLEAAACSIDIQESLHEANRARDAKEQIVLRIGLHVGDVICKQDDLYGDAINVASRIEQFAEPGGVCLSQQVYDHIGNKFELPLSSIGEKKLKNVKAPVELYKIVLP